MEKFFIVLLLLLLLRSSFDTPLPISRSCGLRLSLDNFPVRVAFGVFDPLCLACSGTRVPGGAPYYVVPTEPCKSLMVRFLLYPAYFVSAKKKGCGFSKRMADNFLRGKKKTIWSAACKILRKMLDLVCLIGRNEIFLCTSITWRWSNMIWRAHKSSSTISAWRTVGGQGSWKLYVWLVTLTGEESWRKQDRIRVHSFGGFGNIEGWWIQEYWGILNINYIPDVEQDPYNNLPSLISPFYF